MNRMMIFLHLVFLQRRTVSALQSRRFRGDFLRKCMCRLDIAIMSQELSHQLLQKR
jgi:hypothetical protein